MEAYNDYKSASQSVHKQPINPCGVRSPIASGGSTHLMAHLAPHSDPTSGILSKLPRAWIPYAQLMRLDRSGGFYAFYFPYLIGLLYAACLAPVIPEPTALLCLAAVLLPLNILLRGAACTWNDNVDQDFDRQVERTRHRPIARGAVSTAQAHAFTLAQLALTYAMLKAFFPPPCRIHLHITEVLFFVYALMKRVTYYPQVVLGFPFAWAILFCAAALRVDLENPTLLSTLALFGANVLWTITYDTIYAHQDVADDEQAGVKGMAVRFRNTTKTLATVLTAGQVILLALCGHWAGFGCVYYVGTVGGVAAAMGYYIYAVDLSSPESCGTWFRDQFWIVGLSFMSGLAGEYMKRAGIGFVIPVLL